MSDSIFVGIDVSTKSNKVCILDQQGNRLSKLSVENNSHGSAKIVERVIEATEKSNSSDVSFGLEATSVYGDGLIFFLKQEPSLKLYNTKVFLLNPKQVHNFKKAYSANHDTFNKIFLNKRIYANNRQCSKHNCCSLDYLRSAFHFGGFMQAYGINA